MRPSISVIIPTKDRAPMIGEAIESALSQTWPADEIIVVDDGSTDDTERTVGRYGPRVKYIAQQSAGPSAARNRAIAAASGEWLALVTSSVLLKRDIAQSVGGFDERLPYFEDYDLQAKLLAYRSTPGSLSKNTGAVRHGMEAFRRKLDRSDVWAGQRRLRNIAHASDRYALAIHEREVGHMARAFAETLRSFAWYPFPLRLGSDAAPRRLDFLIVTLLRALRVNRSRVSI